MTDTSDDPGATRLILRCTACGNAMLVPRGDMDPPGAVVMETNECNLCDAANGGFGMEAYYDAEGKEVVPFEGAP